MWSLSIAQQLLSTSWSICPSLSQMTILCFPLFSVSLLPIPLFTLHGCSFFPFYWEKWTPLAENLQKLPPTYGPTYPHCCLISHTRGEWSLLQPYTNPSTWRLAPFPSPTQEHCYSGSHPSVLNRSFVFTLLILFLYYADHSHPCLYMLLFLSFQKPSNLFWASLSLPAITPFISFVLQWNS